MIMRIISSIILIILLPTSVFAELQKPTPDIKPEDVVKIQLSSLMNNNQPYVNAGIEPTWEFAHPSKIAGILKFHIGAIKTIVFDFSILF